jgi:hypothetical protein
MKIPKFFSRNFGSIPSRSSRMKVVPPEVPIPGMAGGGKQKLMAPGTRAIFLLIVCRRLKASSPGAVRSSHGFSVMK